MLKRLLCYLVLQEWQHKCRRSGINCVIPEKKEYDDCFKLYSALPDALRKEMDKIAEASAASMCRDLSADSSGDYLDVRASAALRLKVSVTDGSREIEYTIEF